MTPQEPPENPYPDLVPDAFTAVATGHAGHSRIRPIDDEEERFAEDCHKRFVESDLRMVDHEGQVLYGAEATGGAAYLLNLNNVVQAEQSIRFRSSVAPNITLRQFLFYVGQWYMLCAGKGVGYTLGTPTYWIRAFKGTWTNGGSFFKPGSGMKNFDNSFVWDFYHGLGVWLHEDCHGFNAPGSPNIDRATGHSTDKRSIMYPYFPVRNHLLQFQPDNTGTQNGWWYGRMPSEFNGMASLLRSR